MESLLNRVIDCDIADIDNDCLLGTDKDLVRLQKN